MKGFITCEKCGKTYPDIYPHYTSDCKKRQESSLNLNSTQEKDG